MSKEGSEKKTTLGVTLQKLFACTLTAATSRSNAYLLIFFPPSFLVKAFTWHNVFILDFS